MFVIMTTHYVTIYEAACENKMFTWALVVAQFANLIIIDLWYIRKPTEELKWWTHCGNLFCVPSDLFIASKSLTTIVEAVMAASIYFPCGMEEDGRDAVLAFLAFAISEMGSALLGTNTKIQVVEKFVQAIKDARNKRNPEEEDKQPEPRQQQQDTLRTIMKELQSVKNELTQMKKVQQADREADSKKWDDLQRERKAQTDALKAEIQHHAQEARAARNELRETLMAPGPLTRHASWSHKPRQGGGQQQRDRRSRAKRNPRPPENARRSTDVYEDGDGVKHLRRSTKFAQAVNLKVRASRARQTVRGRLRRMEGE